MDLKRTNEIAQRFCSSRGWGEPTYIANGASAAVYKVLRPGEGPAALKIYDPRFFEGENALIEARRCELQAGLQGHGHPNLIDVIDVGEVEAEGTWYLLMEYCPWPSLDQRLSMVPDDKVHLLIKQLTCAVLFLEGLNPGYVHRDIKPANIAVSEDFGEIKLLDLGVLRKIGPDEGNGTDDDEARRFIATAQYSPPEFLAREELPGIDGFSAINVYQVGAVLHDLIMKEPLFGAEAATENKYIVYKAVTEKKPRVASAGVPVRLVTLCQAALGKEARERIARVELRDFLADADPPDALRRRLVGGGAEQVQPAPSMDVWKTAIRGWIGSAARLEVGALGATLIKEEKVPGALRWRVEFANVETAVFVQAVRTGRTLTLEVVSDSNPPVPTPVLEISGVGVDLPPADIPTAIAAQYLYALDLAQAALNSQSGDGA
ncbi:MAG: protein kinase [Pseudomonadota bacterium]